MHRSLHRLLVIIAFFSFSNLLFSQKNCIECYNILNQIERILLEKDTLTAIHFFESLDQSKCAIPDGKHYQWSVIYLKRGQEEKAREQLKTAIEKGFLGMHFYGEDMSGVINFIAKSYGEDSKNEMLALTQALVQEKEAKYGNITDELRAIYKEDQLLRKDPIYKACKAYDFRLKLGFPVDSTANPREMEQCYKAFKQKDSTLLQRFIDIADSLAFVPDDYFVFGKLPISPIISHTAHFDYKNLEELYLKSVKNGTLSPEVYAWWQGYHEEYFQEEKQLYFTVFEEKLKEFSQEKIDSINQKRLKIGLPLCPAVIWNVKRY